MKYLVVLSFVTYLLYLNNQVVELNKTLTQLTYQVQVMRINSMEAKIIEENKILNSSLTNLRK